MKVSSYLPLFTGFYDTIFAPSDDAFDSYLEGKTNEDGEPLTYDDVEWDFKEYEQRVAEACVERVEQIIIDGFDLAEDEFKITFEKLVRPRYYNFKNDSIDVCYEMSNRAFNLLFITEKNAESLSNHFVEAFGEYVLENYTGRDGFISAYPSDYRDWLREFQYFENNHENIDVDDTNLPHMVGSFLEFLLRFTENTETDLLEGEVNTETHLIHAKTDKEITQ